MKIPILPIVALLSLLALHAAQGAALGDPTVTTQAPVFFRPVIQLPLGDLFFGHLWQLEKLGSRREKRRGRGECGDIAWCKRRGKTELTLGRAVRWEGELEVEVGHQDPLNPVSLTL